MQWIAKQFSLMLVSVLLNLLNPSGYFLYYKVFNIIQFYDLPTQWICFVLISEQVFLGFPVPKSKCWDGSQDSKLPLHASHVALPT